MKTELLTCSQADILHAAKLLRAGEVVAFPTETVYGLGGDALNADAVARIFRAKGRPQDNPLIVHVAHSAQAEKLYEADERALLLAKRFWPGPLTIIRPARAVVPAVTRANLPTVAVRCPGNEAALKLLAACEVPIAAPSANLSGRPSPTDAQAVYADMQGRIAAVLDGGSCEIGVESTVVSLLGERARLLRPGGVTVEMLQSVLGEVEIDPAVRASLAADAVAASPGMKYQHYAPKGRVQIVSGAPQVQCQALRLLYDALPDPTHAVLLLDGARAAHMGERRVLHWGDTPQEMAANLYACLLQCDAMGARDILVPAVAEEDLGLAIMNRLLRAAAFRVVRGEDVLATRAKEEL